MRQPGTKDAVITREMRIRDDEVRKLREKLYDIRELACDRPNADAMDKIYKIADGELWPG